jgi:hypothetical protein
LNLMAAIDSLASDAGVPKFLGGRATVDAADLMAEEFASHVVCGKVLREAATRSRQARLFFPFPNQRRPAKHKRTLEGPAAPPRMRTEVGEHSEGLVCLAETDLVGQYDSALSVDEEASQSGGDDALLVLVTGAQSKI